ncbi:OLC1v1034948C1 [Oldenlandia corymbosa var. corymbosa]|uniref:OLC1v1034948C1 n=1 Tax=Oldenlandia corymbosa var. corymbosa TaxID=529605 RepID=A0AAV1CSJ5_OLDCO|nr:OLC1v1034948C1 [Oldenlandia corymbosa var. corymbosa]
MARFVLLSLIFMAALIVAAEANDIASSPALSPSESKTEQAHRNRKIGGHHRPKAAVSPRLSPSEAPTIGKESTNHIEEHDSVHQDVALGSSEDDHVGSLHRRHHSVDRSVAGGGVILGGLATTFLVAIIWYIRATRRTIAAQEAANKPAAAPADQV